jgi:hypothetical protein
LNSALANAAELTGLVQKLEEDIAKGYNSTQSKSMDEVFLQVNGALIGCSFLAAPKN